MGWETGDLDGVLVPLGMAILLAYHVYLWYRVKHHPQTTVIGVNHLNRQAWVHAMMSDGLKNGVLAVQTLRNSIMASTLLASTAITLSSIIAALVSSTSGSVKGKPLQHFIYGETGSISQTLKYLLILMCFLFAFISHVQSIRYSSHASFLLSIPIGDNAPGLTPDYVNEFIYRSQNFFSFGLRGYYFSFPLLLWIFGPIPMFVCSVVMVITLHTLDTARDFEITFEIQKQKIEAQKNHRITPALHNILSV